MTRHARPHLETHSRAAGHSAVAGVAYRLGLKLYDQRTGLWHDYRKRQLGEEIVRALTVAPPGAPAWATDPELLWNKVEAAERRKDAQVARDYRIPIPFGLHDEAASALAERMARFIADRLHTAVSLGLHRDADRDALGSVKPIELQGFHAHLYFPTRKLDFTVDARGEGATGAAGMGEKLSMLSNKRTSAQFVEQLNAHWASLANEFAAAQNLPPTYEYLSYARLGLDIKAQPTLGRAATAMERKGLRTWKGDRLRDLVRSSTVVSGADQTAHAARPIVPIESGAVAPATMKPMVQPLPIPDVAMITFSPDRGETRVRAWNAAEWGADPLNAGRDPIRFVPVRNGNHALPAPASGSLLARFIAMTADATAAALEDDDVRNEAHGWLRIIERTLRALFSVARSLRDLVARMDRERAAKTDNEMERDISRALVTQAKQAADEWAAAHPLRMAATQAWAGNDTGPAPWQMLRAQARDHGGHALILDANVSRHAKAFIALDEEARPLRHRQGRLEQRLREATTGLVDLDAVYGAQLLGAADDEEKVWLEPALASAVPPIESDRESDDEDAASTGYRGKHDEVAIASLRPRMG
ncbi:MobA/MobL family protein [Luteibacter sp. 9135]|uniref:MobA/MobL family protein n=1 Tax=Luteibacter sp. 9135 TaxID=1500893 RepID=UPI00056B03D4|nr:MobA/MobL family protein [Luteibacter sp. 9135]